MTDFLLSKPYFEKPWFEAHVPLSWFFHNLEWKYYDDLNNPFEELVIFLNTIFWGFLIGLFLDVSRFLKVRK